MALNDLLDMIAVSDGKGFHHNIHLAIHAIIAEDSCGPTGAWLVHDDSIPSDPAAVAVEFPTSDDTFRPGFRAAAAKTLAHVSRPVCRPGSIAFSLGTPP